MGSINVSIIDLNKRTIEEKSITLNEFCETDIFKEENKLLKLKGIEITESNLVISDNDRFIINLLSFLYKDYKIVKKNKVEAGYPDVLLKKGNEELYIEIKLFEDGLRHSQLKWFLKNTNKNAKIMWINIDNPFLIKKTKPYSKDFI